MNRTDIELLVAGFCICTVGLVVYLCALSMDERRRRFEYSQRIRGYEERMRMRRKCPCNMELMQICQLLFLLREIGDEQSRMFKFRHATLVHPFLAECDDDSLLEMLTDTDPASERYRLLREIRFWMVEVATDEWFKKAKAAD